MPVKRTAEEEREIDEKKLRERRIKLQKEIADQLTEQQRIYDEVLHPNSAEAKLFTAAVRGTHGERPLDPKLAQAMSGIDTPTARFEWARAEIARISRKVLSLRTEEKKVLGQLDAVLDARSRALPPSGRWLRRYRDLLQETR